MGHYINSMPKPSRNYPWILIALFWSTNSGKLMQIKCYKVCYGSILANTLWERQRERNVFFWFYWWRDRKDNGAWIFIRITHANKLFIYIIILQNDVASSTSTASAGHYKHRKALGHLLPCSLWNFQEAKGQTGDRIRTPCLSVCPSEYSLGNCLTSDHSAKWEV